jgi:hypothetical protein
MIDASKLHPITQIAPVQKPAANPTVGTAGVAIPLSVGAATTGTTVTAATLAGTGAITAIAIGSVDAFLNPKPYEPPSTIPNIENLLKEGVSHPVFLTGIGEEAVPIVYPIAETVTLTKRREHIQYTLRATVSGDYPIYVWGIKIPVGWKHLEAGEIWKIGTTINPQKRYTQKFLSDNNLRMVEEFAGPYQAVLFMERMKLLNYIVGNGDLPPGNKELK